MTFSERRLSIQSGLMVLTMGVTLSFISDANAGYCEPGANWSRRQTPIEGVRNLQLVSEERDQPPGTIRRLYRSAQPADEAFIALRDQLGIRSVLSLSDPDDEAERLDLQTCHEAKRLGLRTCHVGMRADDVGWSDLRRGIRGDEYKLTVKALSILRSELKTGSVLVHCSHGADRTGMIIALYRVLYQNWSKEEAIREMKCCCHHHFWFHNIRAFIRLVPVEVLRRDVGVD